MKIIGYQGIEGSNSEEAARLLAEKLQLKDYLLLPLVSSLNVLTCVETKKTDYGVVAIRNNHGGTVKESMDALYNSPLNLVESIEIPIHHFLYVKDDSIAVNDINHICSHPQAFMQCKDTLEKEFKDVKLVPDEDTATAARKLGNGIFSSSTGVLCRKNAGEMNNLYLLKSYLEDNDNNRTEFEMYSK
ncbi:P-protein [Candidatus Izimaplasma bacterium HR1]|jgi:prephenate dehydratase|uniref:prephenate dehydratase n=1 Tax=Candidatus Izimoplasma sp. HR1 TaxID=1541959 RepID=UPI0004F5AD56|nr:P-protein [Candidatus Izimaplasma bacterium HR1]